MSRYKLTDQPTRIGVDRRYSKPKRGKMTVANNIKDPDGDGVDDQTLRPIRIARFEFSKGSRAGLRIDSGVVFSDDIGAWQGEWWAALDDGTAGPYRIDADDEQET